MKIFRDDKRYREIEEIKEYELTSCLTFEMAIRNKIVQRSILEYLAINNIENYKFNDIFFSDKTFIEAFNLYYKIKTKKEFVLKVHEIMLEHKFFISANTVLELTSETTDFIHEAINTNNNMNDDPFEYENEDFLELTNEKYINTKSPFKNKNQYDKLSSHLKVIETEENTTYLGYTHFNHYNIFQVDCNQNHRLHIDKINYSSNNISQKFSKPILTIPEHMKKNVNLTNLNFNLQKKEFLSYIESIYDYYQQVPLLSPFDGRDTDDLIDPISHLFWSENSFYVANKIKVNNSSLINIDDSNFNFAEYLKNNISINVSGFESKNLKEKISTVKTSKDWADCFFIFDYIEFSNTYRSMNDKIAYIKECLELYHEKPSLKRNAIRDRFYMMSYYIKALNYKNLLTG